ncbi:predicted protein [Naegleria gruberi]|uniref:Predicted protein n=1 Tax=Naegleria gruberi TaxID=5762 RepID=D2V4G1_NAEGR|nr:uncharacterized protein NAEGRDRAFT_63713 [Naegleria gruberi]EFC48380.1 predicted protein [Naegleria gruberi]|eukprot:XP_002681124.1 predicted protein [Naegleria gruberi strain NEG-M]
MPRSKNQNQIQIIDSSDKYKREFVEGCEWEYECPLKITSMTYISEEKVFCNVCKENIYKVHNQTDLKYHTEQGHCVILTEKKHVKIGKTYNPDYHELPAVR